MNPYAVSTWYPDIGSYSFPTVFLRLSRQHVEAIFNQDPEQPAAKDLIARCDYIIDHLPGSCFLHADTVAPDDAPAFKASEGAVHYGITAFTYLATSRKVHTALRQGETCRIGLRPYRRMDHSREFRLFIHNRRLFAMSQRFLKKHHPRLQRRAAEIWEQAQNFVNDIAPLLPLETLCVDVYLTSTVHFMILDLNPWGPPTDALLLRHWEHDLDNPLGLLLVKKPNRISGDITVSF
ncbi:MAG: hypothetical protein D6820_15945 [Lentisphaerae bacterium]|nr:MAG: hypothetical protein D6820_15945 [Lentisphaerota bacterium]